MKKIIIIIQLMLIATVVYSQNNKNGMNVNPLPDTTGIVGLTSTTSLVELPNFLPASPKVSSIMKYGEYPVSLYTGLVDIKVPIYTIKVNGIEVPVEFKYHASGIRYDDMSLEVGLGWTLIAGGVIEFQVRGSRDNVYTPFLKNANSINTYGNCYNDDLRALKGVTEGNKFYIDNNFSSQDVRDSEADIYTYNFLQYSGQFCNPYTETHGKLGKYILTPANQLVVNGSADNTPITITDDKGIVYIFGFTEPNDYQPQTISPRPRESYYLTKIITADKADTVTFNYTYYGSDPAYKISKPCIKSTVTIAEVVDNFMPYSNYDYPVTTPNYAPEDYYPGRLESITFRGGSLTFGYNTSPLRDLRNIKLYNAVSSTPLQTITLDKSSIGNRGERLDKVTFQNQQGDTYNYQFGYNGDPVPNPGCVDYWGYNNGPSVGTSFNHVPNFTVFILSTKPYALSTTDRSAYESYMQLGVLNKVTYPTKGYTEFTYEAHKANNKTYGGLRIKEIRNYNSDGILAEKKWYQYGSSGQGRAAAYPVLEDFQNTTRSIEQYDANGSTNFKVHTIRQFLSFPKRSYFVSGSSVVYPEVTEYVGDASADIGKTIYYFEDFSNESGTGDIPVRNYGWKSGKLASKTVYKKENNAYSNIYSFTNTYNDINTEEYMNLRVLDDIASVTYSYGEGDQNIFYCYDMSNYSAYKNEIGNSPFRYYNYFLTTGLRVLASSTEVANGVSKQVYFDSYNSAGFLTQMRTISSSGSTKQTAYKYPSDLVTTPVYIAMTQRNMNPVVEIRESVNNSQTALHFTQYGMNNPANPNLIAPISEEYQSSSQSARESRITYNRYDSKGNILHISKDNADQVVYLWSYNYQYPITKIEGATYTEVKTALNYTDAQVESLAAKSDPAAEMTTINNLRSLLPNALVTTYTYKPLVGIASMTDPRGVITTYDYDTFNRLITVKDNNSKSVEGYEYNYKN